FSKRHTHRTTLQNLHARSAYTEPGEAVNAHGFARWAAKRATGGSLGFQAARRAFTRPACGNPL
ncbi:MAG: hypothetical protein RL701_4440, partial [Pseudomonadota bacterium]